MAKRMILMLVVTAAAIAALGFVKFRQFEAAGAASSFQPPPAAVTTVTAEQVKWPVTLSVIGTVDAVQGVTVSADLPGIVARIAFESGMRVDEGDVLVKLDTKQEQAQLAAAEAQHELARLNFQRLQDLVSEGAISRADYDHAAAEQKQSEARVGEILATIERKTIRAPFSGILGIRQVNLGQYLSGGSAVVPLQSLDPIYVNFGVPQQQAEQVRVGRQVQATLANPHVVLRPGMYVQTEVVAGASRSVVPLPATAISYAPYGDSVFVVTDLPGPDGQTYRGVRQQFVKVEGSRGDQVGVISGIHPGDEVVTSGAFKLRNGAAVQVNNEVQLPNNPAPKPEDS
jgi:membrane fusion protein (multidrug efflux system)